MDESTKPTRPAKRSRLRNSNTLAKPKRSRKDSAPVIDLTIEESDTNVPPEPDESFRPPSPEKTPLQEFNERRAKLGRQQERRVERIEELQRIPPRSLLAGQLTEEQLNSFTTCIKCGKKISKPKTICPTCSMYAHWQKHRQDKLNEVHEMLEMLNRGLSIKNNTNQ